MTNANPAFIEIHVPSITYAEFRPVDRFSYGRHCGSIQAGEQLWFTVLVAGMARLVTGNLIESAIAW